MLEHSKQTKLTANKLMNTFCFKIQLLASTYHGLEQQLHWHSLFMLLSNQGEIQTWLTAKSRKKLPKLSTHLILKIWTRKSYFVVAGDHLKYITTVLIT